MLSDPKSGMERKQTRDDARFKPKNCKEGSIC